MVKRHIGQIYTLKDGTIVQVTGVQILPPPGADPLLNLTLLSRHGTFFLTHRELAMNL